MFKSKTLLQESTTQWHWLKTAVSGLGATVEKRACLTGCLPKKLVLLVTETLNHTLLRKKFSFSINTISKLKVLLQETTIVLLFVTMEIYMHGVLAFTEFSETAAMLMH